MTHELATAVVISTKQHKSKPARIPAWMVGEVPEAPSLAEELLGVDGEGRVTLIWGCGHWLVVYTPVDGPTCMHI